MTGRYDEWAAARTPALLRLAHALTGDEAAAAEACRRALQRVGGSWDRVVLTDPDLEVRRHLVRSCRSRDRAAFVLRDAEDRSDAEIAAVLGCSESAARRHVQRGRSAAQPGDLSVAGGREAGSRPVHPTHVALLERPSSITPRRRRGTWAAVVAVLALVGGVAYVAHESRTPGGVFHFPSAGVPQSWRVESYAGVQVRVPDTWGWGGAPVHSDIFRGNDSLGACGSSTAAVKSPADPASFISSQTPFTGRPVVVSDRCLSWGSDGIMPTGDALWFDSPLDVGVKNVGVEVAETRAVGDQHVTVFSGDPTLRSRVLGTAHQVDSDDNGCPTDAVLRPVDGPVGMRPDWMSVCVYSEDTGTPVLLWSGRVGAAGAQRYADGLRAVATAGPGDCPAAPSGSWVALGLHGHGGTRWDLADLSCASLRGPGGSRAPLTPATVRDWARGGVTAYVRAPAGAPPSLRAYFQTTAG